MSRDVWEAKNQAAAHKSEVEELKEETAEMEAEIERLTALHDSAQKTIAENKANAVGATHSEIRGTHHHHHHHHHSLD